MAGLLKTLGISLICLILDQVSKFAVARRMVLHQSIPVIGSFFQLTYIHNPGAAFGIAIGGRLFYILFATIAIILIGVVLYRSSNSAFSIQLSFAMILGGALGNLIDRIRLGEVIDFLDFGIGLWRWPVFNVADAFVTSGIILLSFCYLVRRDAERHREN
ncbi:MAG: signal peptidase II [Candidatus Latescibacteria bacterium]|nr:signal peptidase II [Candidatus Latescibacterota bacterium]